MLKVIAFDLFGTVFDLSGVPREEVKDYIGQVKREKWAPLDLPESWSTMPLHPDSERGLWELKQHYMVVTCSNAPLGLTARMSKAAGLNWDAIIPLEMAQVYKPNPKAYKLIYELMGVHPWEVLMVTGNEGSPDLEGAKSIGMGSQGIRKAGPIKDIVNLAHILEIIRGE
jgi:2-haloalkanoic acid dehalogenase type II